MSFDPDTRQNLDPSNQRKQVSDIDLLHGISVTLIGEQHSRLLYSKIVDAAVSIMGSQFAILQVLIPEGDPSGHGGQLQMIASHGLSAESQSAWEWVTPTTLSSCALALKLGTR